MINVNNNTNNPLCIFCGTNCNRMCRSYRTIKVIVSELKESINDLKSEMQNQFLMQNQHLNSLFTDLSDHLNIVFNDQNNIIHAHFNQTDALLTQINDNLKSNMLDKISTIADLLNKLVSFFIIL